MFRQRFNSIESSQCRFFWQRIQWYDGTETFAVMMELKFSSNRESFKVELHFSSEPKNWVEWQELWTEIFWKGTDTALRTSHHCHVSIRSGNKRRSENFFTTLLDEALIVEEKGAFHASQPLRLRSWASHSAQCSFRKGKLICHLLFEYHGVGISNIDQNNPTLANDFIHTDNPLGNSYKCKYVTNSQVSEDTMNLMELTELLLIAWRHEQLRFALLFDVVMKSDKDDMDQQVSQIDKQS